MTHTMSALSQQTLSEALADMHAKKEFRPNRSDPRGPSMENLRAELEDQVVAAMPQKRPSAPAMGTMRSATLMGFGERRSKKRWNAATVTCSTLGVFGFNTASEKSWSWRCLPGFFWLSLALALSAYAAISCMLEPGRLYVRLCTAFFACGCFLGLCCLRQQRLQDLLRGTLGKYARQLEFEDSWHRLSARRLLLVGGTWLFTVGCRSASFAVCRGSAATKTVPEELVAFIVTQTLFSLLVYCQLHVCSALELSIHCFCAQFFEHENPKEILAGWSMLTAMLRRSARAIEGCFLAISTTMLGTLMLTCVVIWNDSNVPFDGTCSTLWASWTLSPAALVYLVFWRMSVITDQCSRVPALASFWLASSHRSADREHQFMVQNLAYSNAGFFVYGMRITCAVALKIAYLAGIVTLTLVSQSLRAAS